MFDDQRKNDIPGAPARRYDDVKKTAAAAAERISQASRELLDTFREIYADDYNRPREPLT